MKKVDKYGNLPALVKQERKELNKLQTYVKVIDASQEAFRFLESFLSYLSETERTKQVEAEAFARMVESKNRLEEILSIEETIRLELLYKHEETMENLELEMKKIEVFKVIIEHTIQYAVELLENIRSVSNLIDDQNLFDRMHEINLKLLEVAKEIGSNSKRGY